MQDGHYTEAVTTTQTRLQCSQKARQYFQCHQKRFVKKTALALHSALAASVTRLIVSVQKLSVATSKFLTKHCPSVIKGSRPTFQVSFYFNMRDKPSKYSYNLRFLSGPKAVSAYCKHYPSERTTALLIYGGIG